MITAFITVSFILLVFISIIWSSNGLPNILVKMVFIFTAFWAAYLLFNLLPAVELSNGMRLL